MKTNFDTEYTEMNKEENPHILSYIVKSHLTTSQIIWKFSQMDQY